VHWARVVTEGYDESDANRKNPKNGECEVVFCSLLSLISHPLSSQVHQNGLCDAEDLVKISHQTFFLSFFLSFFSPRRKKSQCLCRLEKE
jgi:hypothetical protein